MKCWEFYSRDQHILHSINNGIPVSTLAKEYGITRRRVCQIERKSRRVALWRMLKMFKGGLEIKSCGKDFYFQGGRG